MLTDSPKTAQIPASSLLDAIPNPVLVISGEGEIVFVNPAAENYFQTSARILRKTGLKRVIPATSPVTGLIETVRNSFEIINEYAIPVGTPGSGGERIADLQLAPVIDYPGAVLLMVQKRSVADKLDRQLTHRTAARTVTGMASMLAHEIKNPLSGIRGAAQLLESGLGSEDLELTRLICSETDRIRDLVNQMEAFSDERPLAKDAVNIHAVLAHVKKLASAGFASGIKIIEHYDPSLPPVLGNRDQLVQVMMNLVKNAAEAMPDDGTGSMTLSTSYRPGVHIAVQGGTGRTALPLEVSIANTGPPIPAELLPHIFDPFVSSKPNGKGLGLALTAKIIGDHGGIIDCESNEERTVFRILLPMSTRKA